MSENSKIEWTDHTFNPWIGCTRVSPGCDHCYAAVSTPARAMHVTWGAKEPRHRTSANNWRDPLKWNARHAEFFAQHSRCERVFCASLADVFDNEVPVAWRTDLLDLIRRTPRLDWLLLTKRIGNVTRMLQEVHDEGLRTPVTADDHATKQWTREWLDGSPPVNVWLGATIVNQEEADRDIPKLLSVPAAKHFLSMEPLLGPVDLERPMPCPDIDQGGGTLICQPWMIQSGIDWVIVGGESGANARPMHPAWVFDLRDQCKDANVSFLFKQWGEWAPGENCGGPMKRTERVAHWWADDWLFSELTPSGSVGMHYDDEPTVYRVGKKTAGRTLDGVTHDEFPT
ncbi:phage Gp37/Gp68 family protein [Paraburkholderia phytofirmans]|uniref:phage Gp37/Gp68 family protein n=1 Tax=Paraburkholderia phytofirmans TaxID=261302 RepID=UPI0038B80BBF